MSIPFYKVKYTLTLPGPAMSQKHYHTAIFALTNADGSGITHHVTGDLVSGMRYETKPESDPEQVSTFHSKELLGTVPASMYPAEVERICREQPPPPKQMSYNTQTNRMEQQKPDGRFYAPGEPQPPLVKCTEWTEYQVIPALYASGVLRK
ncbi:MAG: hypothetical protein M1824_001711 [Vezdaea acicularis]|nr:MAG: hypothetical protein M1824_001711 [Vezdaea acicularis]